MNRIAKTNKTVMTAIFTAQIIVLLGYFAQMAFSNSGKGVIDFIIAFGPSLVCDIAVVCVYIKNRESTTVRNLLMASLLVMLAIMLFLRHNPMIYILGFPLIIALGYYNDYKLIKFGCSALLVINIVAIGIYLATIPGYLQADMSSVLFQIITHIFLLVVMPASVKSISEENKRTVALEQKRADETAELLERATKSTGLIEEIMAGSNEAAGNLAQRSQDMADAAGTLQAQAESGKQKVEELTEMMAAFRERTTENAGNAESSITIMEKSYSDMTHSLSQMEDAIKAINNIQSVSREIGNINNTIETIAFQTNILALNAAVEAARAGSAGKGFAVVAEEVRSLSQRSSTAASETSALVERAVRAIEKGSAEIQAAAGTLDTLNENFDEMMKISRSIAESVHEQREIMQSVTRLTDDMSDVMHRTSETADKSLDISRMLRGESESLHKVVSYSDI